MYKVSKLMQTSGVKEYIIENGIDLEEIRNFNLGD